MKALKVFLMAVLVALSGCAALDKAPWRNDPSKYEEVTVRWLRMPGSGFVDQDGVCNVQLLDSEEGLKGFYSQVQTCRQGSVRQVATEEMKEVGTKKIRIFVQNTTSDVENRSIDIYGMQSYKATVSRAAVVGCWQGVNCRVIGGFIFSGYGWDGIVIARSHIYGVGHEVKHLYDGDYHYPSMRWKSAGKSFVPNAKLATESGMGSRMGAAPANSQVP
jgi:hypothetical protein